MVIEQAPAVASRSRRSRTLALPWILATVLTVVVLAAGWWQSHPTAFEEPNTASGGPARVGEPVHVDSGIYTHDSVTLLSIRPRVAPGSPTADIALTVCRQPEPTAGGVGFTFGDLDPYCGVATGVEGARLGLPIQQVVVTVRAHDPGMVRIEGFDVRYRDGLRIGTQHTGASIEVTVTG